MACLNYYLRIRIAWKRCGMWPALVVALYLHQLPCSAQERTITFINLDDSLKRWNCPLPVEATIRTKDKEKID